MTQQGCLQGACNREDGASLRQSPEYVGVYLGLDCDGAFLCV